VVEHGDVGDRHLRRHELVFTLAGTTAVMPCTPPKYSTPSAPVVDELTVKPSVRPSDAVNSVTLPCPDRAGTGRRWWSTRCLPSLSCSMARIFGRAHGGRIGLEADRAIGLELHQIQALAGADPDAALRIFMQAGDVVVAQAAGPC
jgi:hypothetical protein